MINPDAILKILEGVSYLSNFGILVVASIGLKQLSISKQASRLTAKRDALKLSNEQVKYYLENIIPLLNTLSAEIDKHQVTIFKKSSWEIKDEGIKVNFGLKGKQLVNEMGVFGESFVAAANSLEGFATYFTSELADERVAFKSVGKTYCDTTERYMAVIAGVGGSHYYQNIIELYKIWSARLKQQRLLTQQEEIAKQLKSVDGKIITPIGADETTL